MNLSTQFNNVFCIWLWMFTVLAILLCLQCTNSNNVWNRTDTIAFGADDGFWPNESCFLVHDLKLFLIKTEINWFAIITMVLRCSVGRVEDNGDVTMVWVRFSWQIYWFSIPIQQSRTGVNYANIFFCGLGLPFLRQYSSCKTKSFTNRIMLHITNCHERV